MTGKTKVFLVNTRLSSKQVLAVVTGFMLLNLLFLAGTWIFTDYYRQLPNWDAGSRIKYLLVHFNLATENVLAVWYSSMLLLLIAIMVILCFVSDQMYYRRKRDRLLSFGWILIAVLFTGLSLDEMGSLHERIGMLAVLNPFGDYAPGWVDLLALPIGLVALFMLMFGWLHLRKNLWVLMLMIVGVGLFVSIPFQEHFEVSLWHSAPDRDAWQRPTIHILLEEGSELFGMLSFLSATLVYLISIPERQAAEKLKSPLELNFNLALLVTITIIGLLGFSLALIKFVLPYIAIGDSGKPENWFPSVLAMLAGILNFQIWRTTPYTNKFQKLTFFCFGWFCILTSIYYGANMPGWLSLGSKFMALIKQTVHISLITGALVLGIAFVKQSELWWSQAGVMIWLVSLSLAFVSGGFITVVLAFMAFSMLLLSLLGCFVQSKILKVSEQSRLQTVAEEERSSKSGLVLRR